MSKKTTLAMRMVTKEQAELLQFVDWELADRRRLVDTLSTHKLVIAQIQTLVTKLTRIQEYRNELDMPKRTSSVDIFENMYYWLNELRDEHSDQRDEYKKLVKEITP